MDFFCDPELACHSSWCHEGDACRANALATSPRLRSVNWHVIPADSMRANLQGTWALANWRGSRKCKQTTVISSGWHLPRVYDTVYWRVFCHQQFRNPHLGWEGDTAIQRVIQDDISRDPWWRGGNSYPVTAVIIQHLHEWAADSGKPHVILVRTEKYVLHWTHTWELLLQQVESGQHVFVLNQSFQPTIWTYIYIASSLWEIILCIISVMTFGTCGVCRPIRTKWNYSDYIEQNMNHPSLFTQALSFWFSVVSRRGMISRRIRENCQGKGAGRCQFHRLDGLVEGSPHSVSHGVQVVGMCSHCLAIVSHVFNNHSSSVLPMTTTSQDHASLLPRRLQLSQGIALFGGGHAPAR